MKKTKLLSLLTLAVLLLAACSPQSIPNTGIQSETPAVSSQAVLAAQSWLAQQLGVQVDTVEILSQEQVDWSDSCLGLGGPAEICAQAITPGWRVALSVGGQQYEVRTDESGAVIRMAGANPTPDPNDPLVNTAWTLVSLGDAGNPTPALEGAAVTLSFAPGGQAAGTGGCNAFGTMYTQDGTTIKFDPVTSTLMACADESANQQEQRFFEALKDTGKYTVNGDTLTIQYNQGQGVLTFKKSV